MVSARPRSTRQLTALVIAAGLVIHGASVAHAEGETASGDANPVESSPASAPLSPTAENDDSPAPEESPSPTGTTPTDSPASTSDAGDDEGEDDAEENPSEPGEGQPTEESPSPTPTDDPSAPTTGPPPTDSGVVEVRCAGTTSVPPGDTVTVQCSASGAQSFAFGTDISQLGGQVRMEGNQVIYTAPDHLDTANTDVFTVIAYTADGEQLDTTSVHFTVYGAPASPTQPPGSGTETPGAGSGGPGTTAPETSAPSPAESHPQESAADSPPDTDHPPVPGFPTATPPAADQHGSDDSAQPLEPADQDHADTAAASDPNALTPSPGTAAEALGDGAATDTGAQDVYTSLARTGQGTLLGNATVMWALTLSVLTVLMGGTAVLISRRSAESR